MMNLILGNILAVISLVFFIAPMVYMTLKPIRLDKRKD